MGWFISAPLSGRRATVYALNASTGAKLWSYSRRRRSRCSGSSPAVANGVVYFGSVRPQRVCAERQHRRQVVELYHRRQCGILARRGEWGGLCRFIDGDVYALNASTGAKLWSFPGAPPCESSPAVANGVVYIGSDDGNVYALNASTGAKLWSFHLGSFVITRPPWRTGWFISALTRGQFVCAECQHWRLAVELFDGMGLAFLALCRGWGSLRPRGDDFGVAFTRSGWVRRSGSRSLPADRNLLPRQSNRAICSLMPSRYGIWGLANLFRKC